MVERQIELRSDIQVALVAGIGRLVWVNDSATRTAGLDMFATRTMAGFAADIDGVVAFRFQAGMGSSREITCDVAVTLRAVIGADKSSTRNSRRDHDGRSSKRGAGDQNEKKRGAPAGNPEKVPEAISKPPVWGVEQVHVVCRDFPLNNNVQERVRALPSCPIPKNLKGL